MSEWQDISVKPNAPTMAVMAIITTETSHLAKIGPGRDERFELGWWTGKDWREAGTAHAFDEREGRDHCYMPTHWMPLPAPPPSGEG